MRLRRIGAVVVFYWLLLKIMFNDEFAEKVSKRLYLDKLL